MRRKDREVTDMDHIVHIISRCTVCRVAFNDVPAPYIVPLNFGMEIYNDSVALFFHCAPVGKKLELMMSCPDVAFEMDCPGDFLDGDKACDSTMAFESVCGTGTLSLVSSREKVHALECIMKQYSKKDSFAFDDHEVKAVTVLKLTVTALTAKRLALPV